MFVTSILSQFFIIKCFKNNFFFGCFFLFFPQKIHSLVTHLTGKQQQHDIKCKFWEKRVLRKKSESQMGFKPTTLHDLVGCSTTEPLETYMVSKGSQSIFSENNGDYDFFPNIHFS